MIKTLVEMYRPRFAKTIIYMLQASEYQIGPYLKWFWRVQDFSKVMHRKQLVLTRRSKLLLRLLQLALFVQYIFALIWLFLIIKNHHYLVIFAPLIQIVITPVLFGHLIIAPLILARYFIIKPYYWWTIKGSADKFAAHSAIKIAVAGSYGKTTMKEVLLQMLSDDKVVAATPANKNVSISHAKFINSLSGNEEILIIEFGEGAPGDVARFARITRPDIGIITGLAPAHLDKYKTLQRAGEDIFSLAKVLAPENVYVNKESKSVEPFLKTGYQTYNSKNAAGWEISDIKNSIDGVSFVMKKSKNLINIKTQLLGLHQVGPLAAAAALAFKLGLSVSQIEKGAAKIQAYEHRMEVRHLGGATIIDDTYNGNIEGMNAGLSLLSDLPAKRKIYVTPGLVDQGKESATIHQQLGEAIGKAKPDIVVLMQHSVTNAIQAGIKRTDFKGQLIIEEDPLNFYNNLDQFVAAGDLVLMQNDWPDNYS